MRILLSAYACEPHKGSEPEVGWNWTLQVARHHEVWVITRANNETSIAAYQQDHPLPNVHWVYYDLPFALRFWKKRKRGLHLYYYLWQIGAYLRARSLHGKVGFDLVNHVTFVMYWMPSFMCLLPIPFVWGPVGGGESAPRSFYSTFSFRGRMLERLRDLVRRLAHWDPFVRTTARRARVVLATTAETALAVKRLGASRVEIMSQVALSSEEQRQLAALPDRDGHPFRVLSIGSLLHLKGFHLGIAAFARFVAAYPSSEYWVIGDGPERARLERLSNRLGVARHVRFLGAMPRRDVLTALGECDVVVHPTLHDSGGFVCLEAMAAGRPVICLDLGGPATLVTDDTGVKIRANHPDQTTADLAAAMAMLAHDRELRRRLATHGRERVRRFFDWHEKGRMIDRIYAIPSVEHGFEPAAAAR